MTAMLYQSDRMIQAYSAIAAPARWSLALGQRLHRGMLGWLWLPKAEGGPWNAPSRPSVVKVVESGHAGSDC
jgi:hypothetical protein